MATPGKFNIFSKNYDQPDKKTSAKLFSTISQSNQNQSQRPLNKETVSKRQNFGNQIRKQHKENLKRGIREQLIKTLESNDLFNMLESMALKNNVQSKNISNYLSDLKKNMNDFDFCKKLDQSNNVKQFLLDFYVANQQQLPLVQKSMLVHSLIFLTYFGTDCFQVGQKQLLNQLMIRQLQQIKFWNIESIEYFNKLIDLLTNITADDDENLNYYLMDTNIFPLIAQKITEIQKQAVTILKEKNNEDLYKEYLQNLDDIRKSFIITLFNLSKYDNQFFFQYTVNEFVNDRNYLATCGIKVMNIFANFFCTAKFRQHFIQNSDLVEWFQRYIPSMCQKRFQNAESIKTGNFQDVIMRSDEKELFYQFLSCLMIWIDKESDQTNLLQMQILIQNNLNGYCLSEFLIQSAGCLGQESSGKKNSVFVAKAIQIYEYLASDPKISIDELLIVTSKRTFEDVLKVFLNETYFTSCKISDITISVLNKMLSKNHQLFNTLIELRIIQSIDSFLSMDMQIQTREQILNFFELLILMIVSNDQLPKDKNKERSNQFAWLLQIGGHIKKLQRYQNHQERDVVDKTQAFLDYLETVSKGNV